MKILLLTDICFPTDHSFLEEVYAKRFVEFGHQVSWIMRKKNATISDSSVLWHGSKVILLKNWGVIGMVPVLFTAITMILNIGRIIDKEDWDIIQVRNDPIMGLFSYYKAKKHKKPFIYQYSFYKSNSLLNKARKISFSDNIKGRIGRRIEISLLKKADIVLPISITMANELSASIKIKSIYPCPLGVDENQVVEKEKVEQIKMKYRLNEETIVYLGTLGLSRQLEFLVDVYEIIKRMKANIKLLIIGDAPRVDHVEKLQSYVKNKGFSEYDIIFTGRIPRADVPNFIECANICVSPIPPTPTYIVASPIKLMDYLNCGKPVVANKEIIEQEEIVNSSKGGLCVNYEISEFAEAILFLLDNKQVAKRFGENGKKYIRAHRNYTDISRNLEDLYLELLSGQR